jgi:hypothetical protein
MALTDLQKMVVGMLYPSQPAANASIYDLARADAQNQTLGNLGAGLIGAAVPQTPLMRAQALQSAFAGMGNMGTNVYNAAQARLMAQKAESEAAQLAADQEWLQSRGLAPQSTSAAGQLPSASVMPMSVDSAASRLAQPLPPSAAPVRTSILTPDDIRNINENIPPSERAGFTQSLIRQRMVEQAQPTKPPAAPSGFRNILDENQNIIRQEPIPGGPGSQIPAELAARLGLAKSFLEKDLSSVKKTVKEEFGDSFINNAFSRAQLVAGAGTEGQMYRRIQSGTDALQRMLTGAGMQASEAANYANRYLPSFTDTQETMLSKLDGLEQDLRATLETATQGRGGMEVKTQETAPEATTAPTQTEAVDYNTYVGQPSGYSEGYEAIDENKNVVLVSRNGKWELP